MANMDKAGSVLDYSYSTTLAASASVRYVGRPFSSERFSRKRRVNSRLQVSTKRSVPYSLLSTTKGLLQNTYHRNAICSSFLISTLTATY